MQAPCHISTPTPTSTIVGLWHKLPLVPGCRFMPGHCCPPSARGQGRCPMHSTQARPPRSPPGMQTPKAHPQPSPVFCPMALGQPDLGAQSCARKQLPKPSDPLLPREGQGLTVWRCRAAAGSGEGARPVSQLRRGCQSPASAFGPAPARTFTLPGGILFRRVPNSSHCPLLPSPPDPHCPPSTSVRLPMTPGPAPRELRDSRTVISGTDGTRARRSWVPAQAAPGTCADSLLPARCRPAPPARAPPEERPSALRRGETGQILPGLRRPLTMTTPGGLRGPGGHGPRELPGYLGCPKATWGTRDTVRVGGRVQPVTACSGCGPEVG